MPPARYLIGLNPLHLTEEHVGVGLSGELFLGKQGIASLYLPVSVAFADVSRYYQDDIIFVGGSRAYWTTSTYNRNKEMLFFYPGVKIYPAGAFKKVSYAIGTHLAVGVGSMDRITTHYSFDSTTIGGVNNYILRKTHEDRQAISRLKLGVLISNSLNLRPANHLYLGLEFAIGFSYLNMIDNRHVGTELMVQGGVKFGYIR
jgi:hypothetical protein